MVTKLKDGGYESSDEVYHNTQAEAKAWEAEQGSSDGIIGVVLAAAVLFGIAMVVGKDKGKTENTEQPKISKSGLA